MAAGPWQIVIIALVILLLFGASRLGDIGKGLGEGIKNFKKGITDDNKDPEDEDDPKQLTGKDEPAAEGEDDKSAKKKA